MKRYLLPVLSLVFLLSATSPGSAQPRSFRIGDKVDVMVGGDPKPGTIVGGLQDSGFGYGTYQVHLDGEKNCSGHKLDTRYNAAHIQARLADDSGEFGVGDVVEVRRWDGSMNKARILSVEGDKYRVRYDGKSAAWDEAVEAGNVRPVAGGGNVGNAGGRRAALGPKGLSGGDQVRYSGGTVLWNGEGKIEGYDPEGRTYQIRSKYGSGETIPCYGVALPGGKIDNSFFIGRWEVHIYGATSSTTAGGKTYRSFSSGMKMPPLEIKADGTYVWVTDKGVIRGRWTPRPESVPGIVLLKGEGGLDYTIYEKTEAFAANSNTRDEIGLHNIPTSTGYYHAFRTGEKKSCVLAGRKF